MMGEHLASKCFDLAKEDKVGSIGSDKESNREDSEVNIRFIKESVGRSI